MICSRYKKQETAPKSTLCLDCSYEILMLAKAEDYDRFNSWGQGVEKSPSVREGMNRTPCNGVIDAETAI